MLYELFLVQAQSGQVVKKCDRQTFDEASRLIVEKFGKIYVVAEMWNVEALDYAIKNNYIELFLMDKTVKAEDRLAYSLKCVMIHNEIKKLLGKENEIKVKLDMI